MTISHFTVTNGEIVGNFRDMFYISTSLCERIYYYISLHVIVSRIIRESLIEILSYHSLRCDIAIDFLSYYPSMI